MKLFLMESLIIKVNDKYNLEVEVYNNNLAFQYRQIGREDWTSFHHDTEEEMIENLRLLSSTGYAALPEPF